MSDSVRERLDQIEREFAELAPRERLELLLEFAEGLPPLSPEYAARRDAGEHRVHECRTPVYIWVELHGGRVRLIADVAPEAPTVKGFVGILAEVFKDAPSAEVLAVQPDVVTRLGLTEALGMIRLRGLGAILHAVHREVLAAAAGAHAPADDAPVKPARGAN